MTLDSLVPLALFLGACTLLVLLSSRFKVGG
jgi:hypothetical protein